MRKSVKGRLLAAAVCTLCLVGCSPDPGPGGSDVNGGGGTALGRSGNPTTGTGEVAPGSGIGAGPGKPGVPGTTTPH